MSKYDLTEAEEALLERAGYYAAQDDILGTAYVEDEDEDEDEDKDEDEDSDLFDFDDDDDDYYDDDDEAVF